MRERERERAPGCTHLPAPTPRVSFGSSRIRARRYRSHRVLRPLTTLRGRGCARDVSIASRYPGVDTTLERRQIYQLCRRFLFEYRARTAARAARTVGREAAAKNGRNWSADRVFPAARSDDKAARLRFARDKPRLLRQTRSAVFRDCRRNPDDCETPRNKERAAPRETLDTPVHRPRASTLYDSRQLHLGSPVRESRWYL